MSSTGAPPHLLKVHPQRRCSQTAESKRTHAYGRFLTEFKDEKRHENPGSFVPENGCGSFPGVSRGLATAGHSKRQYLLYSSVVDVRIPHFYQPLPTKRSVLFR